MANIACYTSDGSILNAYPQWSTGQKLVVRGADTSFAPVFSFSNAKYTTALYVESEIDGNSLVVSVPDILLQEIYPIIIYVTYGVNTSSDFSVRIPVMPRPKPGDYVFDDNTGSGSGSPGGSGANVQIANNLETDSGIVALAAAQGVVLKAMIDDVSNSAISNEEMDDAISAALEEAKESGEFDGRGIESIEKTNGTGEAGSTDTYTITYTDGTTSIFYVYNGSNGESSSGAGSSGENGATFTPHVDTDGNLSWSNDKGLANPATVNIMGPSGSSGETPIRGMDYWTDEDIAEIKTYVDEAILGGEW